MLRNFTLFFLFLLYVSGAANAQTGIGTTTPNAGAELDVTATNKGLLIPRIALSADNVWTLTGTPTEGMLVYNTATAGTGTHTVAPGFYYWRLATWLPLGTGTTSSIGTANFICGNVTSSSGLQSTSGFTNGTAYSGTVTAPYTGGDGGSYAADVQTMDGLTLSHAAGTLALGAGQIVYSLSGTYTGTTGATDTFTLNLSGSTCTVTLPAASSLQASNINCQSGLAATGAYELATPITAGSAAKTITVTPSAAGVYSITTNTVAGITFSTTGTFSAAQVGTLQNVVLQASGTPTSAGVKTFTVTAGTQTCSFNATVTTPATFNCSGITNTITQNALVSGNTYTGTVTLPYTAGSGNAYPALTLTSNGLTLSRAAGTYSAASGNVVYTLSGTYTGASGTTNFTLPESGCVVYAGSAAVNPGSLSCSGTLSGTYAYGTAMTAANTKQVSFSVSAIGPYTASTNTVNGVTFSMSGTTTTLGANTVIMTASGTPVAAGTYTYTITVNGQTCSFTVTFNAPATFNCSAITSTFTTPLVNGTVYNTGTLTETYTAGNGAAYPAGSVGPINGLTLSTAAGTYAAAGGTITYTISGTFTGTTNNPVVFTLPESGCTVIVGAATYVASSINCGNGAQLGTYTAGIATTSSNSKVVSINVASVGGYSVSSTANGVTFAAAGAFSATGTQNITLVASGTPLASGTFNYTVALGGQSCTFSITYAAAVTTLCSSVSNTVTSPLTSGTSYTGTVTVPYISGNGNTYGGYTVGPFNGLTLTRVAGTYLASGGNIVYNLSGTYTGTTNAQQSFTLAEGCTVLLGQPDLVAGSLSCGGTLSGVYQSGISAVGSTKTISFTNTSTGGYSITSTNNANIAFTATGTLNTIGNQNIVLTATGTPNNYGTFNYSITLDGQTCTFPVTILPVANVACGSITNGLPSAPTNGTTYSGTVTEPYTAGNGQAYGATTLVYNGVTLTRVAGTYAPGGGTVVYNIGGTFSAATGNLLSYSLPESGCVVSSAAAVLPAGAVLCGGTAAGAYTVGAPMTSSNFKNIGINVTTGGPVTASTNTVNGVSFATTTPLPPGGFYSVNLAATGTPIAAGTFTYTITANGQTCSFPVTYVNPVTFNCSGVTTSLTGPLVNGTAYTGTVTSPYTGGTGAAYPSSTTTVSGLTLTAVAGTYAGPGGNITYNLSGTYTGATNAGVTFTLPESGCTVNLGAATFTTGTLNCGGALAGNYQQGVAATVANTKVITVDVATPGSYNITSNTISGMTFSASGYFTTTGTQTVTLTASGMPTGYANSNFTVSMGAQSCTFTVNVAQAITFLFSSLVNTLPASLVNGTTYSSGSVSLPYTSNGVLGSYGATSVTVSGLTLTRVAGTYGTSGNVVYNISGTYTGTTGASVNFVLTEGFTASAGGANYAAGTLSCGGSPSGNYVQNVAMTASNTKSVTISVINPGAWTGSTTTVNGVNFSGSGTFSNTGTQTVTLTATGTPAATGTFVYTVILLGQTCTFSVTFTTLGVNCAGIINNLPTLLTNGTTYSSGSVTLPYTSGNSTPYGTTTVTVSGLTLTRVAGVYAAGGGNIVYNLNGTYSGGAGATVSFNLPDGCTATAGSATITSPDCSGTLSGTYQAGLVSTSSNTKQADINFTSPGFYSISVPSVNGVSFSGSGYFTTAGVHTVTLTASGTPLVQGTFIYTLTAGGLSCTFPVTFSPSATFNCGQISGVPVLTFVNGATYSANITEPYTLGNGSAYGTYSSNTAGIFLTRAAGVFAPGGGNVAYTLSGTANVGGFGVAYTLPESGCLVVIGAPQYVASSFTCGGALSGTYTAGITATAANTKAVSINVSVPGTYAITSNTVNGITFAGSGSTTALGQQDIVLTATGTPTAPGTYYYLVSLAGQSCNFAVTYQ